MDDLFENDSRRIDQKGTGREGEKEERVVISTRSDAARACCVSVATANYAFGTLPSLSKAFIRSVKLRHLSPSRFIRENLSTVSLITHRICLLPFRAAASDPNPSRISFEIGRIQVSYPARLKSQILSSRRVAGDSGRDLLDR